MASRMVPAATAFRATSRRLKRERVRSADHLEFIRTLPCIVTLENSNIEAAHISYPDLRYGKTGRGKGTKEDDCYTVPLCAAQHRNQHAVGDEENYWRLVGIDPVRVAIALYVHSGDYETAMIVIQHAREK